jgi:hypothetical protein
MTANRVDPKEIPLEPAIYSFMMNLSEDKKQKKAIQAAIDKYNKTADKAFKQLTADLRKCLEG